MKTSNRVGIRTCSDYSPFGVELDGRTVSGGYRLRNILTTVHMHLVRIGLLTV